MSLAGAWPLGRLGPAAASESPVPGSFTWAAAACCALGVTGAAAGHGSRPALIAIAAMLVLLLFLLRPVWGLAVIVALRPGLDRWSNTTVLSVHGHLNANPGSLVALLVVATGGVYLLENWPAVRRAPSMTAFVGLLVLALLSIPLSNVKGLGIEEILRLAAIVVLYGLAFVCVRSTRSMCVLASALICSGLVPACVALYQTAYDRVPLSSGFPRVRGSLATFDALGILMALVIVFAAPVALSRAGRLRILACVALPVMLAALLASYGRTGWIGTTLGVLVIAAVSRRWWMIVAVLVLVAAIAIAVPSTTSRVLQVGGSSHKNTFTGRVREWTDALPSVEHRPLLGQGFGSLSSRKQTSLLSDYVRTLVELGIPGLLVYLWLLATAVVGTYRGALVARYSGDRTASAVCLGAAAVVPVFALMSSDSNLLTQIVIAGTAWTMIACGHAMAEHDWHGVRAAP